MRESNGRNLGKYLDSIRPLVITLSTLDRDMGWDVSSPGANSGSELLLEGRPLSREVLEYRRKRFQDQAIGDSGSCLSDFLLGKSSPGACLLGEEKPQQTLQEFLRDALARAIKIVEKPGEQTHGAIYVYNPHADELVMAASQGFPLSDLDKWYKEFATWLKEDYAKWLMGLREDEKSKVDADPLLSLQQNIARLGYIHLNLRRTIATATLARDPWVRDELLAFRHRPQDKVTCDLDCNKDLIGVAYYRLGGRGITVELFDPVAGPKLERPAFFTERFRALFRTSAKNRKIPDKLGRHMRDRVLRQRTVAYTERAEMAAGRSVKAGVYEGLQFPHSAFIGPFLGTVLRFNGEHLGILKVEKHQFARTGSGPPTDTGDPFRPWKTKAESFAADETFDFLMFAYALSGILYLLKHEASVDLSEGWTTAPLTQEGDRDDQAS